MRQAHETRADDSDPAVHSFLLVVAGAPAPLTARWRRPPPPAPTPSHRSRRSARSRGGRGRSRSCRPGPGPRCSPSRTPARKVLASIDAQVVVAHRDARAGLEGGELAVPRAGEHGRVALVRRRRRAAASARARSCARAPRRARPRCRAPRRAGARAARRPRGSPRASPSVPPSSSTSAPAQSSFSTSTRSSVSTRLKWVPTPTSSRGRCGIIVAVRPLSRSIGPTRKCVRSTTCAIRSPRTPEPASSRKKRHDAAESGAVGIVREEDAAVVVDVADRAGGDQAAGVRDGGREAVAEAHRVDDAGLPGGLGDGDRLVDPAADGLLHPQVLAGLDDGGGDLAVEGVRRGDADHVDGRVLDDGAPVARRCARTPSARHGGAARR